MLSRLGFEIEPLVKEILDALPENVWKSKTTTFFDPAIAGGQFISAVETRLFKYGHSKKNISNRVYGCENHKRSVKYAVNKHGLIGTYYACNFLEEEWNMKFDVIVGNPPFNNAPRPTSKEEGANGNGGTGGNSRLYKHFRKKSLTLLKENGLLAFVSLKGIVKDLYKDNNQIELLNLMTDKNHWGKDNFNTIIFYRTKCN